MATSGGQGLPALLLLLLRLCEASAGRPEGPAGGGSRQLERPREPALGAALSLQVSCREQACARPCGERCPAEPPRCAPGVPAVLDGCSCCLVCARQRGESCSPLLPCDESSGLYCDRGPEDGGGATGICMGRWRRAAGRGWEAGRACPAWDGAPRGGEETQPSRGQPRCALGTTVPGFSRFPSVEAAPAQAERRGGVRCRRLRAEEGRCSVPRGVGSEPSAPCSVMFVPFAG